MSSRKGTVLVAEDQRGVRSFLVAALEAADFDVVEATDGAEALRLLERHEVDCVLTDLRMPGADGMAVLARTRQVQPDAAVLVLTAYGTIEGAVDAMRAGAADFLTKPVDSPEVLVMAVQRALGERRLRLENERLRRQEPATLPVVDVIQADPRTKEVMRLVEAVAPTRSTVLFTGESGTGKEVFARAVHELGSQGAPFVALNCAALPRELLESELFGHEKGAFTGAAARRQGRFELAGDGTLFLDELGMSLQAKLLRVLQEGVFERVGGTRTLRFGGRVIAATNRDLRARVAEGAFREDLFYRLNVFPIPIPPLRKRPADILPLAEHLLGRLALRAGGAALTIDTEAAGLLTAYPWPGNVRELANVLERATILARDGALLPELLPVEIAENAVAAATDGDGNSLRDLERQAIVDALDGFGGNRRQAADRLGISLRTLQYRLREYGLARK